MPRIRVGKSGMNKSQGQGGCQLSVGVALRGEAGGAAWLLQKERLKRSPGCEIFIRNQHL